MTTGRAAPGAGSRDADVVVAGGGPAGAAAAISCAQAGLRVLLVDAGRPGGDRPGETLHPGMEPLLARLGVADEVAEAGFPRPSGQWLEWYGERRFQPFGWDRRGPWRGYQAWRGRFDELLRRRAADLGVDVWRPCRAAAPVVARGRVAGIDTDRGRLRPPYVVDATGDRHWLARRLRTPVRRRSPALVADYGWVTGPGPSPEGAPLLLGGGHGWTWIAHVRPSTWAWVRLRPGGRRGAGGQPPLELAGLTPAGPTRRADVTWRAAAAVTGPGYFVVGDAATVVDPGSAHGVLKAVMSGMRAAHGVAAVLGAAVPEESAALDYERWLGAWFDHDTARLRKLYRATPWWPGGEDGRRWDRGRSAPDEEVGVGAVGR